MFAAITVPVSAAAVMAASLLGAIVGAHLSGRTARQLDALARRRAEEQGRAEIRAAAAFIRADLNASRRRLREAMEDGEWQVFYRLPTAAWREHGPTVATSLRPDDLASIAYGFARLEDFERALSELPIRRFGFLVEGAPRPIRFNKDMREKVKEIAALTGNALSLLEPLAPHALQPPAPLPGQKQVRPINQNASSRNDDG